MQNRVEEIRNLIATSTGAGYHDPGVARTCHRRR
jgi:hypothetical protein